MPTHKYLKQSGIGKASARSWAYNKLGRQIYRGHHVVIASRNCGDIDFLLGVGVLPSNIIVCDKDEVALYEASNRGVVISPVKTIEATTEWALKTYNPIISINVDLCGALISGVPILKSVLEHINNSKQRPTVFFTYARYHDGMKSDMERRLYLYSRTWCPTEVHNYQSITATSKGSPMSVSLFGSTMGKERTQKIAPQQDRRTK
jgi:hypothetical protein